MDSKPPPIPVEPEGNILEIPKRDIYLERLDAVIEFIQVCTDETGENPWEYFRMHLEHKLIESRLLYQVWIDQEYD
jgi:hypothetical protein